MHIPSLDMSVTGLQALCIKASLLVQGKLEKEMTGLDTSNLVVRGGWRGTCCWAACWTCSCACGCVLVQPCQDVDYVCSAALETVSRPVAA